MKPFVIFIINVIYYIFVVVVGIIYSILFFIYDPKAMIKEKKSNRSYWGGNRGVDWEETLSDPNFWCPYIES
jgi:hypothetical protein